MNHSIKLIFCSKTCIQRAAGEIKIGLRHGREVKLHLGENHVVSVAERRLTGLFYVARDGAATWTLSATRQALEVAHEQLCELVASSGEGLIPVKRAGKGSTEKSCKVVVSGVHHPTPTPYGEPRVETHTITVPRSQLVECGGKIYAPRWLLARTLHERIFDRRAWPTKIDGGIWLQAAEVWRDFWEPMLPEIARLEKEDEHANKARLERIAIAEVRRKKAAEEQATRDAAARAAQLRREKAHQKHLDELETIHAERVEWDAWVGPRSKQSKETFEAKNCTIKFSGDRAYIVFPDGTELIKARRNIRFEERRV